MADAVDLSSPQRDRLNAFLDGCFWNACFVDRQTGIAVIVVELVGLIFDSVRVGDAYPVVLVCHPVGRVAAAFEIDGVIRPLAIEDINAALQEFNFKEIDDCDIIDPPEGQQPRWLENPSLDVRFASEEYGHFLQMWQDGGQFLAFDLALWFQRLFLFDANFNSVSLEDLEEARKFRLAIGGDIPWRWTATVLSFTTEDILRLIEP